jgi:hypothetical protein
VKITIENTSKVILVKTSALADGVPCRVWEGTTESGIEVQCLIVRIAAAATEPDLSQFESELQETRAPSAEVLAFPLRMVL